MGYDFDIINNGTSNAFHGYTCVCLEGCIQKITSTWGAGGMGQALGTLAVPSRGLELGPNAHLTGHEPGITVQGRGVKTWAPSSGRFCPKERGGEWQERVPRL